MKEKNILQIRFNYLRKKNNLTFSEIRKKTNISQGTISKISNGDVTSISTATLLDLCKCFGVSSDYLLGLTDIDSNDYDMNRISKKIGLSAKSLNKMVDEYKMHKSEKENDNFQITNMDIINFLLEHPLFDYVIEDLKKYFLTDSYTSSMDYYVVPSNLFNVNIKTQENITFDDIQGHANHLTSAHYGDVILQGIKVWLENIRNDSLYGNIDKLKADLQELKLKQQTEELSEVDENILFSTISKLETIIEGLEENKK